MKKILKAFIIKKFNEGKITNVPPGITTAKDYVKFLESHGYKGNKEVQMLKRELTKEVHKKVTPIVKAAIQKWKEEKKKEIVKKAIKVDGDFRLLMGRGLVRKQDIETPKVSDYNSEEDDLVKRTKIILANKMIQLKRLIKKHPFVAKHIYNQLDALNKFVEQGNYKQAIVFVNDLIAKVEKIIADEEGKVAMLEVTKAEDLARANVISLMDKLTERLQLDESVLLGKDDGLGSDHFREEEEEEEEEEGQLFGKEYFDEKEAARKEKEKQRIKEGKYVKPPKKTKPSKPPKIKQIGISKPLVDEENKSMNVTYPVEYEEEVKAREEAEKQKDRLTPLKEAFEDLTPEEKNKLIQSLLKRK